MRRAIAFSIAGLLLLGTAARAQADEDEATQRAKELFKNAEVHFSVGEFSKALALYKEAFKTKPLPAFLFNIGQCHRNMGQCDKALFFFKQYLVRTPEAPNRADVEKLIEICEQEVKQGETGKEAAPPPPAVVGPKKQEKPDEPPPSRPSRSRRKLRPLWFWSSVGLAGALLVTGTVTGVMALSQSDEYKDPSTTIDRRRDLKDSGEALRTVSTATVVAGAVVAAGAGVLYFLTDWGRPESATVSAGPLPGGAAVVIGGRF